MQNSPREHLARAQSNLKFAQSFDLKTSPYIDWVPTLYFYAALHLVEALLLHKDRVTGGEHKERWILIKEKSYLRGIKDQYHTLKDRSEDARYRLITFTSTSIQEKIIPLYEAIEKHILPQLPQE